MDNQLIFEACVESLDEAIAAEEAGAHRIELCSALDQEGLSPSQELTLACLEQLSIPLMAMVRPRGGDFVYSEDEIREMENEIDFFKEAGVAGVVFGLLTDLHFIDVVNLERLVRRAHPLEITFHKAIDYSYDVLKSFQELNNIYGITRVLTSGGMDTAWHGRLVIKEMNELPGRRIQVIAAGKITPENRDEIIEATGVTELHGRHIVS
ncbi:MAG: copper homeostasis protein CutC [Prolixibacteraceae bacterium]